MTSPFYINTSDTRATLYFTSNYFCKGKKSVKISKVILMQKNSILFLGIMNTKLSAITQFSMFLPLLKLKKLESWVHFLLGCCLRNPVWSDLTVLCLWVLQSVENSEWRKVHKFAVISPKSFLQKEIKIYKFYGVRSINNQDMSQNVIYLQNVNNVSLFNSNKTTFFPHSSELDFIEFPRQIYSHKSCNVIPNKHTFYIWIHSHIKHFYIEIMLHIVI